LGQRPISDQSRPLVCHVQQAMDLHNAVTFASSFARSRANAVS
jgi:hypothetical protein